MCEREVVLHIWSLLQPQTPGSLDHHDCAETRRLRATTISRNSENHSLDYTNGHPPFESYVTLWDIENSKSGLNPNADIPSLGILDLAPLQCTHPTPAPNISQLAAGHHESFSSPTLPLQYPESYPPALVINILQSPSRGPSNFIIAEEFHNNQPELESTLSPAQSSLASSGPASSSTGSSPPGSVTTENIPSSTASLGNPQYQCSSCGNSFAKFYERKWVSLSNVIRIISQWQWS